MAHSVVNRRAPRATGRASYTQNVRYRRCPCTERAWPVSGEATLQVPAQVEYERATSVAHALTLLSRYAPGARVLAGGHSLIPMMKLRLVQPEVLVDISRVTDLRYIEL